MKKLLLAAALLAAACAKKAPVISSFSADRPTVNAGEAVTLSWQVSDATTLTVDPAPGPVTGTSVTVTPAQTTTYTLRAQNTAGSDEKSVQVTVNPALRAATITSFTAVPAQITAGQPVTLKWSVSNANKIEVFVGTASQCDCSTLQQLAVQPTATTTYTLKATGDIGAPATLTTMVRVVSAPAIAFFKAANAGGDLGATPTVYQGDTVTLTWDGDPTSWQVSDGTNTTNLGPAKKLVVRPLAGPVTYTLTGFASGVSATKQITINVTPRAGTTLVYTPPTVATQALKLVADACAAPCTTMTFHLQRNVASGTRGAAFDLPVDPTKIAAGTLTPGLSGALSQMVIGTTGGLKDTLAVGVALKGSGGTVAADSNATELASFTVTLKPEGGQGVVFTGSDPKLVVDVRGSGVVTNDIAIGTLSVQ